MSRYQRQLSVSADAMVQTQIQNHVSLVLDESGSMAGQPVVDVVDAQLNRLKQQSIDLNQETRISIYLFNYHVRCLVFDMDVMRFKTIKGYWKPDGYTALIDATRLSLQDHAQLPQLYGNHHYIHYIVTDGGNNVNNSLAGTLKRELEALRDNCSVVGLMPDAAAKAQAIQYGFHKDDLAVWTVSEGVEKVGNQFADVMSNFMTMRAAGIKIVRGSLLKLDSSKITRSAVKQSLKELSAAEFDIFPVRTRDPKGVAIKEFVESWTQKPYRVGSAYYQPVKKVKIQDHKHILIQDIRNGRVYEGDNIRPMLGLPDFTVEVDPGQHKDWRILPQSTSVNRKVFNDTFVLVRK